MEQMTDKERILMRALEAVVNSCYLSQYPEWHEKEKGIGTNMYAQWWGKRKFKKGDLVLCQSIRMSPFKVGFVEEVFSEHELLIREIGTSNTCRVSNENFIPIRNLPADWLYEKEQQKIFENVKKVLAAYEKKTSDFQYRLYGIHFSEDGVKIRTRFKFFNEKIYRPLCFELPFKKNLTQKAIREAFLAQGLGERYYERVSEPEKWMAYKDISPLLQEGAEVALASADSEAEKVYIFQGDRMVRKSDGDEWHHEGYAARSRKKEWRLAN